MKSVKQKEKEIYAALKDKFGYKNPLAAPRLLKIVVSAGIGSVLKKDPKKKELVLDRLAKITGQRPALRGAKKSIAGFKIRQGDPVGALATLRGARMRGFLDKLLNIAIPRMKDFRGLDPKSVDGTGNLTFAVREHTIFPETSDEDIKDIFGLAVTVVTTARARDEALAFFRHLGFPFKK